MKNDIVKRILPLSCFIFLSVVSHAQLSKIQNTRWLTDENTIIQIMEENKVLVGKEMESKVEKYKPYIGKIALENIKATTNNEFTGTLIDPETSKKYAGKLILSDDGKTLAVKVKVAFMTFNRKWVATN